MNIESFSRVMRFSVPPRPQTCTVLSETERNADDTQRPGEYPVVCVLPARIGGGYRVVENGYVGFRLKTHPSLNDWSFHTGEFFFDLINLTLHRVLDRETGVRAGHDQTLSLVGISGEIPDVV